MTNNSKTKKGVKRKADTTTPVITTFAGKESGAAFTSIDALPNDEDLVVTAEDSTPSGVPGKLQTFGRRESSGRMIRPPRSRDLDSGENVSFVGHC